MALSHRLRLVAVVVLASGAAACGSDAPTREEAGRQARSAPVRQASEAAATGIAAMLSSVGRRAPGLTPVATSTTDICHAGSTNGFFPHDKYRLVCRRDEARYFAADGDLLDVLREVDAAAKRAGLGTPGTSPSTIEDVVDYYAADGKTEDGLLLPRPGLGYTDPRHGWTLGVSWSEASDPRGAVPDPGLDWPVVLNDRQPVDLDALWEGPLRNRRHLITMSSSSTYHEIPWPD